MDFPWMGVIFWVGAFFWFSFIAWTRYLREQERQKTLRTFAERGQPLDPQTLEKLFPKSGVPYDERPNSPAAISRGLMIGGLVTTFSAAGLLLAGQLFFGQIVEEARLGMSGAGTIVGMVGLGMLVASFVMRRQAQADRNERTGPADNTP
jgi:hypothetical protein